MSYNSAPNQTPPSPHPTFQLLFPTQAHNNEGQACSIVIMSTEGHHCQRYHRWWVRLRHQQQRSRPRRSALPAELEGSVASLSRAERPAVWLR